MKKKAIILVSGGVDSSVLLALVHNMNYEIHLMSFDYQQRHIIELEKIKNFSQKYNIMSHKICKIDLSIMSSSLTYKNLSVPKYNNKSEIKEEIPNTYVPARNTVFLSYALGYSEVIQCYDIFLGIHFEDAPNYPDCRPEYIEKFSEMANLATAHNSKITIHTPLISMTKFDIIQKGIELNVNFASTISCYDPNFRGESCGKCHSCVVRLKAFEDNSIKDPILYQK